MSIERRLAAREAQRIERARERLRAAVKQSVEDAGPVVARPYSTPADKRRFLAEAEAERLATTGRGRAIQHGIEVMTDKNATPAQIAVAWQPIAGNMPLLQLLESLAALVEDIAAELRGAA